MASLQSKAAAISGEIRRLSLPESPENIQTFSCLLDISGAGPRAALKCLELITHVEKILAIELLAVIGLSERQLAVETSALSIDLVNAIRQRGISWHAQGSDLDDEIEKAVELISTYKMHVPRSPLA